MRARRGRCGAARLLCGLEDDQGGAALRAREREAPGVRVDSRQSLQRYAAICSETTRGASPVDLTSCVWGLGHATPGPQPQC